MDLYLGCLSLIPSDRVGAPRGRRDNQDTGAMGATGVTGTHIQERLAAIPGKCLLQLLLQVLEAWAREWGSVGSCIFGCIFGLQSGWGVGKRIML